MSTYPVDVMHPRIRGRVYPYSYIPVALYMVGKSKSEEGRLARECGTGHSVKSLFPEKGEEGAQRVPACSGLLYVALFL